jgi:hypothetical protein
MITLGWITGGLYASESKLVFITSKRYDGNLGGIKGANEICQNHAEAAGITGQYNAWISISSEQSPAGTFAKSSQPYVLKNNTLIAENWDDLVNGQLLAAILVDENGANLNYTNRVWTSTNSNGEDLGKENCKAWKSNSARDSGWVGKASSFWGSEWTAEMSISCDETRNLYCFQQ